MIKKFFLFFLVLIFLSGCGATSQGGGSVSSIYLPIAVGNLWNYRDGTSSWQIKVLEAIPVSGFTIYKLSEVYPAEPDPFPHPYVYFSANAMRFSSQPETPDLSYFIDVLKLPILSGDTYVNTVGTWTIESLTETVVVAAGTFLNCAKIKIAPLVNPATETHYFWLAPGVGLVKSYNPAEQHTIELVSYTVH